MNGNGKGWVYRETVAWTRVVVVKPSTGGVGRMGLPSAGAGTAVGRVLAAAGAGALLAVAARVVATRAIGPGEASWPRSLGPGRGGAVAGARAALPERAG